MRSYLTFVASDPVGGEGGVAMNLYVWRHFSSIIVHASVRKCNRGVVQ